MSFLSKAILFGLYLSVGSAYNFRYVFVGCSLLATTKKRIYR